MRHKTKQQIISAAAGTLAVAGGAASPWATFQFGASHLVEFATFVAGTAGPLWTASGVLFVYVAYLAQREQLDRQEVEIRANSEELRRQNFERTFFTLLDLRVRIIDGIQVRQTDIQFFNRNVTPASHDLYGRSALQKIASYLVSGVRNADDTAHQWEAQGDRPYDLIEALTDGYDDFHKSWKEFTTPLNGNALFLVSFVESASGSDRENYRRLLRAHLSIDEVVLLVYHAWWLDTVKHEDESRAALRSAGFLDDLADLPILEIHRPLFLSWAAAPSNPRVQPT